MSDAVSRGTVEVEINFYEPPANGEAPYQYAGDNTPTDGQPARNYGQRAMRIALTDIRNEETHYTLDKDAFQAIQGVEMTTPYESFLSEHLIKEQYFPEVEKLLLEQVKGAESVILFDHVVRMERNNGDHSRPLFTAHADQTARAAAERVRLHVRDRTEVERLLQGRFRIINVWKPLRGPVRSTPLAFATCTSVDPNDIVPIEFRLRTRRGEIVGVRYNDQQRWMYWSGMQKSEILLLKCNDTRRDAAQQVPHSAFTDPRILSDAEGRESIEVRALVFGG